MTDCQKVPLIEFLRAELDGPQTEIVLAHLETCQTCQERLQVMTALAASGPAKRERRFNPKVWLLAAAIVIALLAPLLYRFPLGGPSLEQLATHDVYPAPFALVTRDGGGPADSDRRKTADQAYTTGDYQTAARLFAELPPDGENLFYLGVCQYYLGRYEQASRTLEQAIENDARWRGPGLWYQASSYLKLGRQKEATETLRKLKDGQDVYAEKARDLLARLDSR